jgi:lysine-specific demethylase/histidyl-hydroxylase NO66
MDHVARPALARCIGVDVDQFADAYWGQSALLSERLGAFDDLLSLAAVDEIVSRRGLRTPFIRMARDGKIVPVSRYTRGGGVGADIADQVDADAVLALVREGSTLVLQGLHRLWPPLIDFTGDLAADLGHPVQVNAYVTPAQSQGFAPHYDVHDVFVLQVAGHKRWQVREPVRDLPWRDEPWEQVRSEVAARAEDPPAIDAVLEPGDGLYLPRGWIHSAQALGGTSAHLTFGVHVLTRRTLLEAVLDAMVDDGPLRSSLPLGGQPTSVDAAAVADLLSRAADLAEMPRGRDLMTERVSSRQRTGGRPEPIAPLAQLGVSERLAPGDVVRWRRGLRESVRRGSEGIDVVLSTRRVRLPAAAEPIVSTLRRGEPCSVAGLGGEVTLDIVRTMLAEGLVVPVSQP